MDLSLQRVVHPNVVNWIRNNLRLLGVIYAAREADLFTKQDAQPASRNEPGLDSEVYREPQDREWDAAWRVTERVMVQMRDEVVERGAKFLLVTGSMGIQVNPDPNTRQAYRSARRSESLLPSNASEVATRRIWF